jgi:hypothetical protein
VLSQEEHELPGTLIEAADWWAIDRADVPAVVTPAGTLTHGQLKTWSRAAGEGVAPGPALRVKYADAHLTLKRVR